MFTFYLFERTNVRPGNLPLLSVRQIIGSTYVNSHTLPVVLNNYLHIILHFKLNSWNGEYCELEIPYSAEYTHLPK